MQHPDEGTIHAWLDGELGADEVAAFESHVTECDECSASVAEARGLSAASSRIVSALDIVPAGVIPISTPRIQRRWYHGAQFRAAAAVVFVAAASLLLMRRSGQQEAARGLMVDTPAASETTAPAAPAAENQARVESQNASKPKDAGGPGRTSAVSVRPQKGGSTGSTRETARVVPSQSPAPAEYPIAQNEVAADMSRAGGRDSARRFLPQAALRVAGTAADEAQMKELTLVKADSAANTVRNVYEVAPGIEITLVETATLQRNLNASASAKSRVAGATSPVMAPAAPPPAAKAMSKQAVNNSITWTNGGRVFTLTGPMSREELEALRLRLPKDKR